MHTLSKNSCVQPVATKPKRGGKEAVKPKSKPSKAKPSKAKKQAKVPAEDEMEEGYDEETHSPDGRTCKLIEARNPIFVVACVFVLPWLSWFPCSHKRFMCPC